MQQYYALNSSPDAEHWQTDPGERSTSHEELLSNGRCQRNMPLLSSNRHMDHQPNEQFSPCDGKTDKNSDGFAIKNNSPMHTVVVISGIASRTQSMTLHTKNSNEACLNRGNILKTEHIIICIFLAFD